MMRNIYCFNAISKYGTDRLTADYALTDDLAKAEGCLLYTSKGKYRTRLLRGKTFCGGSGDAAA